MRLRPGPDGPKPRSCPRNDIGEIGFHRLELAPPRVEAREISRAHLHPTVGIASECRRHDIRVALQPNICVSLMLLADHNGAALAALIRRQPESSVLASHGVPTLSLRPDARTTSVLEKFGIR